MFMHKVKYLEHYVSFLEDYIRSAHVIIQRLNPDQISTSSVREMIQRERNRLNKIKRKNAVDHEGGVMYVKHPFFENPLLCGVDESEVDPNFWNFDEIKEDQE